MYILAYSKTTSYNRIYNRFKEEKEFETHIGYKMKSQKYFSNKMRLTMNILEVSLLQKAIQIIFWFINVYKRVL